MPNGGGLLEPRRDVVLVAPTEKLCQSRRSCWSEAILGRHAHDESELRMDLREKLAEDCDSTKVQPNVSCCRAQGPFIVFSLRWGRLRIQAA